MVANAISRDKEKKTEITAVDSPPNRKFRVIENSELSNRCVRDRISVPTGARGKSQMRFQQTKKRKPRHRGGYTSKSKARAIEKFES